VIYAELSMAFARIEELDAVLQIGGLALEELPRGALFLAGRVFLEYRRRHGTKADVLPDFFVGAHAAVARVPILTRDGGRYRTYFPTVELIAPA
jgi:predicted nucleic acid-binding protein